MISGNIHEKSNLAVLPEPLQRAVQFLKDNDLAAHEPGKFELDGDKMILQVIDQSTGPRENLRPECHRKYIDVQFLAAGDSLEPIEALRLAGVDMASPQPVEAAMQIFRQRLGELQELLGRKSAKGGE